MKSRSTVAAVSPCARDNIDVNNCQHMRIRSVSMRPFYSWTTTDARASSVVVPFRLAGGLTRARRDRYFSNDRRLIIFCEFYILVYTHDHSRHYNERASRHYLYNKQ